MVGLLLMVSAVVVAAGEGRAEWDHSLAIWAVDEDRDVISQRMCSCAKGPGAYHRLQNINIMTADTPMTSTTLKKTRTAKMRRNTGMTTDRTGHIAIAATKPLVPTVEDAVGVTELA